MVDINALTAEDLSNAEHHVLETETPERINIESGSPAEDGLQTVAERFELKDRARNRLTELTLFDQGTLKLVEHHRKKLIKAHRFKLRYLDPVPTFATHVAKRCFYAALGLGSVAGIAALLAKFSLLHSYTLPLAIVATTAAVVVLLLAIYRTHDKIVFRTLHGHSPAITLTAGFGYVRRFRSILPSLVTAIEEAAESIGDDTMVFLREEMREHYRLRGDGILTPEDCNSSTEKILAQFDFDP